MVYVLFDISAFIILNTVADILSILVNPRLRKPK